MEYRLFNEDEKKFIKLFWRDELNFDIINDFYDRKNIDINAYSFCDEYDDREWVTLLEEILFADESNSLSFDAFRIFNFFEERGFDFRRFSSNLLRSIMYIPKDGDFLVFTEFILSKIDSIEESDFESVMDYLIRDLGYAMVEKEFEHCNNVRVVIKMIKEFYYWGRISISDYRKGLFCNVSKISVLEITPLVEGFELVLSKGLGKVLYLIYDGSALYSSNKPAGYKIKRSIEIGSDKKSFSIAYVQAKYDDSRGYSFEHDWDYERRFTLDLFDTMDFLRDAPLTKMVSVVNFNYDMFESDFGKVTISDIEIYDDDWLDDLGDLI